MSRRRSLWAWGWADKLPPREPLAQLARAMLPAAEPVLATLPPDEPEVAAPRVAVPPELAAIASQEPRDRAAHARGRAWPDQLAGLAGDFAGAPDVVVRPRDAADIARVLAVADARGWAVVPFGGGTSVVGGVDAAAARAHHLGSRAAGHDREALLSLDLAATAGVHEVDATSRLARIGAGTFGPELEVALAAHGLTLRHFPQSFEHSTLGGWLATRAGGHYATGATHIDDFCHAVTLVTPRGELATHRHPASGAGPEAARLVLGSEGALGVIAEAWMRVVPRPQHRASASFAFARFDDGVAAARALAQSGLMPSNCRLLDAAEARLHRVRFDGKAVLLVGFESADHAMTAWLARALELARDCGGELATGPTEVSTAGEAGTWRQAFFDAPYLQSALLSIGVLSDTFETACTWTAFPELHARVTAAVTDALAREAGGGLVSCRFTHVYPDGPAPYYTFVGARASLGAWRAIKAAASDALAAAGGTITHHHAVGRTHLGHYARERSPRFADALTAIKRTLDPNSIMNPGVLL
jgi:alkyldihydroxyacetonephosphate synthase|nr:FAD-binding oxidoreductase [Kofleriaceae bacterium]